MDRITTTLKNLARDTDGQDLVEYALLVALIVVTAVAGVRALGDAIVTVFWSGIGQAI